MWDDLVKRLREGVVCVDPDVAGVSGVISESKTDALCYEAADMIEELEAIVASMERDIREMEKRNENLLNFDRNPSV